MCLIGTRGCALSLSACRVRFRDTQRASSSQTLPQPTRCIPHVPQVTRLSDTRRNLSGTILQCNRPQWQRDWATTSRLKAVTRFQYRSLHRTHHKTQEHTIIKHVLPAVQKTQFFKKKVQKKRFKKKGSPKRKVHPKKKVFQKKRKVLQKRKALQQKKVPLPPKKKGSPQKKKVPHKKKGSQKKVPTKGSKKGVRKRRQNKVQKGSKSEKSEKK